MSGQQRIVQAKFALSEAYKYGLKDTAILEEIGDFFDCEQLYTDAQKAFETLVIIDQTNGSAY